MSMRSILVIGVIGAILIGGARSQAAEPADDGKDTKQSLASRAQAAKLDALQVAVELRQKDVQFKQRLQKKGYASQTDLRSAEIQLEEARIKLAQARNDRRAAVTFQEAAVKLQQQSVERLAQLREKGFAAAGDVLKAEVALQQAKARLALAQAQLALEEKTSRDDEKLQPLLKQRRDVLREQVKASTHRYRSGEAAIGPILEAMSKLVEAELDLAAGAQERIALRQKQVQIAQDVEELAQARHRVAESAIDEVLGARAARLQAEIDLYREQKQAVAEK